MEAKRRVAIIGAAAAGLPSARHALLYGFEPVIFEMSDDIGGLWRYKHDDTDESGVMKSTIINTSKEMTAYSDFPPPAEFANFMHNVQVLEYLRQYAIHFDLLKHIRFRHKVLGIARSASYATTGRWTVKYRNLENDAEEEEEFEGVVIATGHHSTPRMPPKWPGQDSFRGRIIHSHSYKDHRGLEDTVSVVVGVGNSGCDAAVELSHFGKIVYLVTRRGTWVYGRVFEYGIPFDIFLNSRFNYWLASILPESTVNNYLEGKLERRFNHEVFGLKPKHRPLNAHPTANDELPNRIASGTLAVKPNIKEFTETDVVFEDGTVAKDVDLVVFATGYSYNFELVEEGKLIKVEENKSDLFKFVFPIETADHNSLAVVGYIQPLGSIMAVAEMQARVFFDVLSGRSRLPGVQAMRKEIALHHKELERLYVRSPRHTMEVNYTEYMDELACVIGCKPNVLLKFLTDPKFAWVLLFGANAAYAYRVRGPHAWQGAREALMNLNARVLKPTMTRKAPHQLKSSGFPFLKTIAFVGICATVGFHVYRNQMNSR